MKNSPLVNIDLTKLTAIAMNAMNATNADCIARTSPAHCAVVQAIFMQAVESVHADLAVAYERGALPSRVSVRSLSPLPGTQSFIVDVRPDPNGACFRPITIDRVLVRMTDEAMGNRAIDGVNASERLRPTTVEMITEAYSPMLHRPTPRYPKARECCKADDVVDLLTRLLL